MALVEFHGVGKQYGAVRVLEEIDLRIDRGDLVTLTGATGSGKSTLLRLIYMEERPTHGHMRVDGFRSDNIRRGEIPLLRRRMGILFQDFKLLPERSAFENVAFALLVTGTPGREIRKRVTRVLAQVGLGHKRNAFPEELSGGEQQRVSLARALVNDPILLLADEPTGNLDLKAGRGIMELFRRVNQQGTAVIMATHNTVLTEEMPGRHIHLEAGRLTEHHADRSGKPGS